MSYLNDRCSECLENFKQSCAKKPRSCFECEWKDRNLPYRMRKLRCDACVAAFVSQTNHDCSNCIWNNDKRRMPTDATLAHCEACIESVKGDGAMNCENCKWMEMPENIRRPHCLKCSVRFSHNSKVKTSTNELSNKGQVIISYDNHNSDMVDDRDTVTNIASDYTEARKSLSGKGTIHPAFSVSSDVLLETKDAVTLAMRQFAELLEDEADSDRLLKANEEYAHNLQRAMSGGIIAVYEKMKLFLYEMCQLTDMQALLLLSEIRGDKKTDFARNHNIKDTSVNVLFKQLLMRSPIFKDFIVITRGSIKGTRGRKSKDGKSMEKVPLRSKKDVFVGVFQPTLSI